MHNLSKNGLSVAALIVLVFGYFDVELDVNSVGDTIAAGIMFLSLVGTLYNQIMRQDVKWFFFKK